MKTSRPGILTLAALLMGLISISSLARPLFTVPPSPMKVFVVLTV